LVDEGRNARQVEIPPAEHEEAGHRSWDKNRLFRPPPRRLTPSPLGHLIEAEVMTEDVVVRFENLPSKAANEAARTLANALRSVDGVTVERARENEESLDFGATLVLALGTPAVVALANAIAKWANRTNQGSITFERGRTVVRNIDSKDAAAIIEALKQ
jgi:hypothetical protein